MTLIRAKIIAFTIMALITLVAVAQSAFASSATDPASVFVSKLGEKALTSLVDKDITSRERESRVAALLGEYFDTPTIARFALGTYWKTATEKEQKEYIKLFEDMIVKTYAMRFSEYSGQSLKVLGALEVNKKDSIVSSHIIQKDGPPVSVEWRVRNKNGQYRIIDVIVESISMSVTQRADFSAVIQKGGGKMEALLQSLRLRKNGAIAGKL